MTAVSVREGVLPIVLDGDLNDPAWSQAIADQRLSAARPARRRTRDAEHGSAGHLRRDGDLRRGASLRFRAGSHRRIPHAPGRRVVVRLGPRADRFVPRSPDRVPIQRQPGWRQTGLLLVQRLRQGQQLGRGVGCRGPAGPGGLVRGVPDSVFAAPVQRKGRRPARLRRDAQRRSLERDDNVAAAVQERERLRVVVR